jgi:acyl-CoA synthetase (NDP forming)
VDTQKLKELEPIFYPKSIAVVGASRNEAKFGTGYLRGLLSAGFKGKVYAVNPSGGKILGLEAYPSLQSIHEPVDYVIVSIPAHSILSLLGDCDAKEVKVVQMFTAGFKESGTEVGCRLEEEITKRARVGGFHIIGPNCIGVYNPEINMPYGMMSFTGEVGSIAFISQSGGVAGRVVKEGFLRGIRFSKVVSFGNGCDLSSEDYLEYLALDPKTEIIGTYLEGVRDGKRLFKLLEETSTHKPIVIWKGGKTKAGAEAAASHTGSLATSDMIWTALSKQLGIIKVEDVEELTDTLLALQHLRESPGRNVALISGIMGGGGGDSVSATDTCSILGLEVPPFSEGTRSQLKAILPPAGSILRNPLDLGSIGADLGILERTLAIVAADPNIDFVLIQEHIDDLVAFLGKGIVQAMNEVFIRFKKAQPKPVVIVSTTGIPLVEQQEIERKFSEAQIPVYPTLERAARALVNMSAARIFRGSG